MDCNQKDFTVRGDKDNVLKNIVNRETVDKNSDLIKRDIYVAYLNGSEFLNYCKKVDDKFKNVISFADAIKAKHISSNDVAKHLKEYYEINHPNVENYTATDIGGLSTEFTAPRIETLALNHVADLMLEYYSKNVKNTKPDIDTTLKEVSKYIMSGFRQEIEEINNSIEDNPKYHNKYKTKYEKLRNRYEELRNKEKSLLDSYKSEKDIKRKNNLRNEILENNKEIFNIMLDIAFNYGNTKQINWRALANQVHTNKTEFYNKVFKNKKLFNIREYFDNVLEDETLNNDEITDENDITNKDNSDIDETSKNWVDKGYSSFTKHVGSKARMYFSTMFNLSAKGELGNETYTYDTNNEMGVRTTMDANFVIAALSSDFINFSSIDNFINSVAELSQTSKQYYSLIVLANKMKKDLDFALMIFHELHNPKINKTQAILNSAELIYRWSNTTSDAKSEKYFQLFNHLRSSYKSINELKNKELLGSINLLKNLNKHNDNSINRVYNILTDIFPMITYSEFISYVENSETKEKAVQHILGCISGIYENIYKVIDSYNKEVNKVSSDKNYEFDYTNIDFTPLTMDCINLANALYKYGKLSIDLNSANAEGNMSSDLIKNNYLTNLIEQINYSTPEDQNKGLEQLKEFVTRSDQYKYSPIFFGVKDSSGKVIRDGIFDRDSDGIVTINKHAKQLLTISLFDGAKNNNDDSAAMYESMGKNDYLITNILAFNNPIRTRVHLDNYNDSIFKLEDRLAGYFMRTPSDAPRNYVVQTIKYITNDLINGKFDELNLALSKVNINNEWFLALKANVLNEVNNFVSQLNNVFEYKNGKWTTKKNTDNLINRAHHNGDIVKNGRLTGNFFKFNRLFNVNGQDYNEKLFNELSLYGGDNAIFSVNNDGSLSINLDNNTNRLIKINNNGIVPVLELNVDYIENDINWLDNIITNACSEFTTNYLSECYKEYQSIKDKLSDYNITDDMFIAWALNSVTAYMSFDDIFEGDSKIYKDARTLLKRAKEVQAGGKSYGGYDLNDGYDAPIHNVKINNSEYVLVDSINNEKYLVPRWNGTSYVKEQLKLRNGFRAITIQNTVKVKYESAKRIKEELQNILKNQLPEKEANDIAQRISNGYLNETAVNDAQSYITFDEFIARKAAEGKLNDYKDIINKLLDPNVKLEDIDGRELNKFVQVLKNFYYDKTYDPHTKTYYSRQIKNAEFVLIPKLIQNTELAKLHDFMVTHDIQQVNTLETSKAGNKNVLVFWDNDGNINENFENEFTEQHHVGKYYYRYLYKQQDVAQHMIDTRNKAGIQLMKKILDNATPETEDYIKQFFDSYVANIKDSFDTFVNSMGWYIKDDGSIASKDNDNIIKFNEFYKKARQEASRLGLDSNFIDYITEDCTGSPIMPNYLSLTAQKQESMAQSIFNSIITRQTLPGWHAAQVSSVGIGAYDENGKFRELKYHPEVKDENGNIKQEAYCEVLIPRWSNLIPKDYPIEKLEQEGLDIQLAYRIPTEGKQSISMIKVVGFLDNVYGSTIIVPDEWVIQTGSDFDVDSVYAVVRPMYKDKDGNLKRVVLDESTEEKDIKRRYINKINHLLKDKVEKEKVTKEDKNKYIEEIKEKFDKEINDTKSLQWQIVNKIYGDALYKLNSSTIKEEIKINFNNKNPLIRFNQILKAADDYIKEAKTEKSKNDYIEFKNEIQKIIDILNTFRNTENEIRDTKNSEIKSTFDELYNKLFDNQFNEIVKRAKAEKLISYEDFAKLPILEQASKDEREAHIIDAMYKIMQHNNSREENYSRSNFAAITNAIKKYDALRGVKTANESVYNPFDQIKFMENAMSGAQLKAFSVTRDNFCSINNRLQTYLSEPVEVIYDLTETKLEVDSEGKTIEVPKYNLELIKSIYNFNENSEDKLAEVTYLNKEKTLIKVKHKRYGWSKNNRNIIGELITAYSSQTTAHILDAIKEGSIFNENKYTFGTFKTLVDLGIDYDTAIAFLMQPAITTINDFNFKKESVYGNEYINPINRSLFTIYKNIFGEGAVRQTNKGADKNKPSEYSSKQSLYDLFNKSEDIKKAIKELFGVNVTKIENYKFPLNGGLMQKRLANKQLLDTISNEDKEFYDDVFDLVMTSTFDRLFNITKQIEGIVRCCNPDKFGAKQTIFETRKVINKIINYLNSSNASGNILKTKDGKNVIQAIYPARGEFSDYKDLKIDINKSKYPYLAAFLQYSTLQSVKINSELFTLENDNIYNYVKKIESSIGREMSLEEYKRFKKFIVKQIIHEVPKLSQPLTIDDNGHIIPDIELIEEYESNGKAYFNEELIRINGYNVTESYQFNVKDFRNPTKEEIDVFKRLTPAQKVLAILKIFTDGAGIFNQINTNIFNNSEYSRKGYNVQSLKFNDQINDIETILSEFSKTYYNKNILVKLATIDLIKYAFINENFAFKKGAISKAIPNRILYTTSDVWGMDLISDLNYAKQNILSDQSNLNDTFITNFIRSNRNLIKVNKLNKEDKSKIESLIHKDINGKSDGLIVIHNTEANESLLNICKDSYEQGYKGFIRLQTTNNTDTLYKIKTIKNEDGNIKTVCLIPLNYLEYNEISDLSLNKDNNKYSIEDYYNEIINNFDSENNKNLDSKDYKVQNYEFSKSTPTDNQNYLIDVLETGSSFQKTAIKSFINTIGDPNKLVDSRGDLIGSSIKFIEEIFPVGKEVLQNIEYDGEIYTIGITRYAKNTQSYKEINEYKNIKVQPYNVRFVKAENEGLERLSVLSDIADEGYETQNTDFEYQSVLSDIDNTVDNIEKRDDFDNVAMNIYRSIVKESIKNRQSSASSVIYNLKQLGFDIQSNSSIKGNKDNIFIYASKFYNQLAKDKIKEIEHFVSSTGEIFDISDERLYKHLQNNPADYNKLVDLLLDCVNIGGMFNGIFDLELSSLDPQIQNAINKLKESINLVRLNPKIKKAFDLIFNNYFANEYSTNPLVKQGLENIRTQFGDIDFADLNIADIGHLNNKQIQVVLKMVNSILEEARMFNAPKAKQEFKNELDEINKLPGSYNQDKIINKDGKLIFEYTENYINDRNKFVDKLAEIKDKQGRYNLNYLKTDLEYKKWLYKNTHQPLAKDYYRREIEILEKVINEAPDLLIEYNKLLEESNKDNRSVEFLTDSEKEDRIKLKQKIKYLSSELNEDGEFKSEDEINKAKALNEYIRNKRILINDYYEYEESDEFKEILNKYLKTKKKYEEDHKDESLEDRLKDSNYREAYEWIQFNTQYKLDNDSQVKVMESFAALSDDGISLSKKIEQIYIREKAFNKFGQKDNSLLSKNAIEEIKKLTEESYENKNDIGVSLKKRGLVSIPTKEAKEALSLIFGDNHQSEAEINTITKINNLLEKAIGKNGEINTKDIFNNLSKDEIQELISLYETLDELKNDNSKLTKEELAEYSKIAKSEVNIEAFEKELEEYEKLDDEDQLLWRKLFAVTDKDGNFKEKKINPNSIITVEARIPNKNIFGYTKYKGKYENTKKSKAIEFIKKHISYETTEEYKDAERKSKLNGTYNEWYDSNHFYNPITNKIEPLRIWTSMVVNPSDEIKGKYDYLPTHDFSTRKIKTNTENKQYTDPNFDPNDTNYDIENGSYNNTNNLTEKELKTLRLFRKTLKKYALSNEDKQFVKKGYLPRQYKPNVDAAYIAKQALEAVGITMGNKENIWTDDINYNNDIAISNKMLSNLKAVGYKKLTPIPKQEPNQSYEEYKKLVDDIKKENETIEKNNLELEKSILNRDWVNVMLNFIEVGETNLSREDVKRTLYLLLEDLKQNDAIAISRRDKRAKQDFSTSTEEEAGYKKVKQKNAIELVENQFRRIVLNEYKQDSPLRKWADLIQNITSAKYMAFNIPGGIANISIGFTNIMGESFAEDFFNNSDLLKGINRYRQSSLKFLYDMYKDSSTDKTVALSKKFDVVDIDAILERKTNEKTSEYAQRVRNSLYSLQSGGEHFMQNSVLFAMLNSHKIFTDVDGKVRIGSLSNYIVNKEIEALRQVLSSNEDYLNRFNTFIKRIKNNLYTLEQYDKFKLDYITEFLKILNDTKITDSYIKTRNKLVTEAKKEFDNIKDTIESQLIFNKDSYELSPDSKITQKQLADFKNKVVYVNKKIHGVYDKIGAAKLESHWYGGLVMQYHKHIYPGIMKRFRIKGYYNEITQNIERGSYVTLARFMATEFKGIGDRINNSESNIALASIQEVVKATINTFMNLKFNYQMLPLWERRNLKRVLGDLSGVVSAMLLGIAIYGFTDDDELKDNDLYALGIYLADRLLSESSMYTPWGAVSEVSTLISNPVAGWGVFKDTYKGLSLVSDMLFNEDFNLDYTRGLYAGENKFKVLLYKNTPIWRVIKRLQNMSENNNYYRINESNINIKLAKRIADYVSPE